MPTEGRRAEARRSRRAFRVEELPEDIIEKVARTQMGAHHDHLDALMD
jgi:hypothetical protein